MRLRACVCAAFIAVPLFGQLTGGRWRTDTSKHSINLNELKPGGPGKDGIPALDHPKFVSVGEARKWLEAKEPLIVVETAEEVRAYPLQILIWHELVNDWIGDTPVLVSFCPLCNSAVVFDRRFDGSVYDFGVSGMLRDSDMVMYDRNTESLWQQITGEAIAGSLTASRLTVLPAQTVSFAVLADHFPQARVLSRSTGYARRYGQNPYSGYEFGNQVLFPIKKLGKPRVPLMERIVAITGDGLAKAYPFSALRRLGVLEDTIESKRYVIFFQSGTRTVLDAESTADSRDVGAVGVFLPELEGRVLTFRHQDGAIVDQQTGSTWNVLGVAMRGPVAGHRLTPVANTVAFAFAWLVFRPETEIVIPAEARQKRR